MKRFLSVLLVLCMVLTLLPLEVFAAETEDSYTEETDFAVSEAEEAAAAPDPEVTAQADAAEPDPADESPADSAELSAESAEPQTMQLLQASASVSSAGQNLYFDQDYVCQMGDYVVVSPYYFCDQAPRNISWRCSDESGVMFSRTSVLNDPGSGTNEWFVSICIKGLRVGDYTVTVTIDGTSASTRFRVTNLISLGQLSSLDSSYAVIDGNRYPLSATCEVYSTLPGASLPTKVLYKIDDGEITAIADVASLIVPTAKLQMYPDTFVYQNGSFNAGQGRATFTISCSQKTPGFFPDQALREIDGLYVDFDSITLDAGEGKLNFGEEGRLFKKEITKQEIKNQHLRYGQTEEFDYTLYVKNDYVPAQGTESQSISATIKYNNKTVNNTLMSVSFSNLDRQKQDAEQAKEATRQIQKLAAARKSLDQVSAISLNAELLEYFTNAQISEMEDYLVVYSAKVMAMLSSEEPTLLRKVEGKIRDSVKKKLLSKLGLSSKTFLGARTTKCSTTVEAQTKSGKTAKLTFYITLDDYVIGERDPYASMASFSIEMSIPGESKKEYSTGGMITLVNLKSFADSMIDYVAIAYNEAWGKGANQVAAMFDAKPIDWFLDGDYSGTIYRLFTKAAKSSVKQVYINCPVDVFVYDEHGNLCAKIVDDVVDTSCQGVSAAVNGTTKILRYVSGRYQLELQGTDFGTMNYTIEESLDGTVMRSLESEEIPLENGIEYSVMLPPALFAQKKSYAPREDDDESEEGAVSFDYDTNQYDVDYEYPESTSFYGGKCGDSAYWELDKWGVLTISGTGSVMEGEYYQRDRDSSARWDTFSSQIKQIVVEDGITSLGSYTFGSYGGSLRDAKSAIIADSVKSLGSYAFFKCSSLENIYLGAGLEQVSNSCVFSYCDHLGDIYVSEANPVFESIDGCLVNTETGTLYHYPHLNQTSAVVPDGVTTLNFDAFGDMKELESVTIPASVHQIDYAQYYDAFDGCTALREIRGYEGSAAQEYAEKRGLTFTSLGTSQASNRTCGKNLSWTLKNGTLTISGSGKMYSYYKDDVCVQKYAPWSEQADQIKSIVVKSGVTTIGEGAFMNCANVTQVQLPASLAAIGEGAFKNCAKLERIQIPANATSIGTSAFSGCSALKSVALPSGLTTVEGGLFRGCTALSEITIPDGATRIGDTAFTGCTALVSIAIPSSVVSIGSSAFADCTSLSSITLPSSVTRIQSNAFHNCTALTSIVVPNGVDRIESSLFQGCTSLSDVTLPAGLTVIEYQAFKGCSSLKSIAIPDGVSAISMNAFEDCSSLTSMTFPASITEISWYVLQNCSSLKSVTIPDGVTEISAYAFAGTAITSVTIPASVLEIDERAFYKCANLTEIVVSGSNPNYASSQGVLLEKDTKQILYYPQGKSGSFIIPDGATSIRDSAFINCSNLTSVTIPDGVTVIGESAFSGCSSLQSVTIPDSVTTIERYAFYRCTSLTDVKLPDSLTTLERDAFSGCDSLTSVTLPSGLTSIPDSAFYNCENLKSITIPVSITNIDSYAFGNCFHFTDVYYEGTAEQWAAITIGTNYYLDRATIHYGGQALLAITAQPEDYTGMENSTAKFTVEAEGEGLSYQWQYSDDNGATWKTSSVKSAIYSTKVTAARDGRLIRCIVTDARGESVTSDVAVMHLSTLKITQQPVDYTGKVNSTAVFTVVAEGEGLTYQWQLSNDGSSWSNSSVKAAKYSTKLTAAKDGKLVRCIVTDASGASVTSDTAVMHVSSLTITTQPQDQTGVDNSTVSFRVAAEGEGLTYQWQYSDDNGSTWKTSSVKSAIYSTKVTAARDGRMIRCIVTDASGEHVTSDVAVMHLSSLKITTQPKNYTGAVNSTATFTVAAEGEGLTYQWQLSNDGSSWSNSSVKAAKYSTKLTAAKDGKLVRCIVTDKNGASVISNTAVMKVSMANIKITTQPQDQTAAVNSTVSFRVAATGEGLTYQWQYSDNGSSWSTSSVKTAVYTTKLTATRDGRMVRCIITDANGDSVTTNTAVMRVG